MYQRFEGSFQSFDATRIFYQGWEAKDTQAHVIISHGQGEHSESYHRVVDFFAGQNISFWAWDMRGHGRSEGIRGYAESFQHYVRDYLQFIDMVLKRLNDGKPVFLLAHSMGALVQTLALLERPQEDFTAQILSAPLFGVAVAVPAYKKHAAEWLAKLAPKITLGNELTNDMLTRDPDIMREFDKDPLRHNKLSSGVYLGMTAAFQEVMNRAGEIKVPTLFMCPEKDPVVDTPTTQAMKEKWGAEDTKILIYGDGARHEMVNDTHRTTVLKDMQDYMQSFMKETK